MLMGWGVRLVAYSSVLMSASSLSAVKGLFVATVVDERRSVAATAVVVRGTFIVPAFRLRIFAGADRRLDLKMQEIEVHNDPTLIAGITTALLLFNGPLSQGLQTST